MDEYLQYLRTLRSQINDVEDQAAKVSVEEQMLLAAVHTLQVDLSLAKSELLRLKGQAAEQISKDKGDICARILDKQKKNNLPRNVCIFRTDYTKVATSPQNFGSYRQKILQ